MTGHAGMDTDYYPGDAAMKWLFDNTNLAWTGLYLPVEGKGYAAKLTWRAKYAQLKGMGWGVAPLYVGKQRNSTKLQANAGREQFNGYLDGIEAASLAAKEGVARDSVLYFDFEGGDYPTRAWISYYVGWIQGVLDQSYSPGIYCSYLHSERLLLDLATRVSAANARPTIWAIKYIHGIGKKFPHAQTDYPNDDPAGSGATSASSWQLSGNSWIHAGGKQSIKVDLNTSTFLDPGLRQ